MGNKENSLQNGKNNYLCIILPKMQYLENEIIEGKIRLSFQESVKVTSLILYLISRTNTCYTIKQNIESFNKNKPFYKGEKESIHYCKEINLKKNKSSTNTSTTLAKGKHYYKFSLEQRDIFLPTIDYKYGNNYGSIKHYLCAKLVLTNPQTNEEESINVEQLIELKSVPKDIPVTLKLRSNALTENIGEVSLTSSCNKDSFGYNEAIAVRIEINNKKGKLKINGISLKFNLKVVLKTNNLKDLSYCEEHPIAVIKHDLIALPGEEKSMTCKFLLNEYKLKCTNYKNLFTLSTLNDINKQLINVCYQIIVDLITDEFNMDYPSVVLPISIHNLTYEEYREIQKTQFLNQEMIQYQRKKFSSTYVKNKPKKNSLKEQKEALSSFNNLEFNEEAHNFSEKQIGEDENNSDFVVIDDEDETEA